ncbi:MAG: helix-turn-helix domain-containing protein, partial [Cytophagales bacterium]|nr:helix-turn-helix domain-containing protein [Cytophagales bacterium]
NKYLDRLQRLDSLIKHRATGTPTELARKMNVSVSVVYRDLNVLKSFGAPLRWCSYAGSYVYDWEGKLEVRFLPAPPNAKMN